LPASPRSADFSLPYPAWLGGLGVPIDHVLGRGVRIAELHALRPIGSDHRPLAATIILSTEAP
jgi:endonuclease/exonuclease/phosphatase (EEP) superfamily protein YafD